MARSAPLFACLVAAALLGCTKKPVLYPNATYQRAGKEAAEHEVEACIHWAKAAGARPNRAGRVAGGTVEGAAVGGAAGAAAGAVRGSAGTGAAMGAAGAAAGGLVRGLLRWREPDQVERSFVERCLRERGYEPVGWR